DSLGRGSCHRARASADLLRSRHTRAARPRASGVARDRSEDRRRLGRALHDQLAGSRGTLPLDIAPRGALDRGQLVAEFLVAHLRPPAAARPAPARLRLAFPAPARSPAAGLTALTGSTPCAGFVPAPPPRSSATRSRMCSATSRLESDGSSCSARDSTSVTRFVSPPMPSAAVLSTIRSRPLALSLARARATSRVVSSAKPTST